MSEPKEDCEVIMGATLPFAERMLSIHGEFFPFGGAMLPNGEIVAVAGYEGDEHPKSEDVIGLIKKIFVAGDSKGKYKATALVYDARVNLPSDGGKSDAIAVSLNHRDQYSVVVFFPYKLDAGNLVFGTAFAQDGEADTFR